MDDNLPVVLTREEYENLKAAEAFLNCIRAMGGPLTSAWKRATWLYEETLKEGKKDHDDE
jgi:hypothetical protein